MCAPRDRNKRKLVIRMEDDANHCWTCTWRARSLAPLLKRFASRSDFDRYLDTFMSEDARGFWRDKDDEEVERPPIALPLDFQLLAIADDRNPDTRSLLRYSASRDLTDHDMWYYRLGRSDEIRWSRRLLMPSFDAAGNLNYLVGRAVDRQAQRYENDDIDKTGIVFNELNIDWKQRLVLCEGPFDLVKCGENATCLLGNSLNENHLLFDRIISNDTPVALALDTNAIDNALWIAKKLIEYDVDVVIVDLGKFKDPGEMTKKQFKDALEHAKPYNWLMNFRHRMEKASRVTLSS